VRIAVDALGGDNAPDEIVAGAISAASRMPDDEILLVADAKTAGRFSASGLPGNVSFEEAGGAVRMDEEPAAAVRSRPDSSVVVCARLVRSGRAQAMFSAGSTGATVAAALIEIGRLPGCRRPAIAAFLPFSSPVLLLDVGATIQCRPEDLLNFAILGSGLARRYFGSEERVRVGLVNVGEEAGKGSDLTKETYELLKTSSMVRFIGNVEGRDIGRGVADVIVTDGFTGNVMLKTAEGVASELMTMLRSALSAGIVSRLAAAVLRRRLLGLRDRVDPETYGGSFLLGVRGLVVIGHGNSRRRGVKNALLGITRTGEGLVEELGSALRRAREEAS